MQIEQVHKSEASDITELTIRSKDHWGYGKEQIEKWREELTITPKYIEENQLFKLVNNENLVGFYAYDSVGQGCVKLNYLFVDPIYIGKGYGKILIHHFLDRVKSEGFTKVTLDADPHAENFYKSIGFVVVGKLETSTKNRYLPIMDMELKTG